MIENNLETFHRQQCITYKISNSIDNKQKIYITNHNFKSVNMK